MNTKNILAFLAVAAIVCGCVTTSTTSRKPVPNADAPEQLFQLGAQYYRNGNYELARDRLERALKLDDRLAGAHSLLALTLIKLGNTRLATEEFNRSVRLDPNNKDVRNNYAIFLCEQGRHDEAREQFDRSIRIRDNDTAWIEMTNAGVCVAKKPDLELAESYFRKALELRPTYGEALIQMAALKHRTGDNLAARAFLQRYLAANPSSPPVLYLGVLVETALSDDRAATDYQDDLLRSFPESAEARLLLQQDQ